MSWQAAILLLLAAVLVAGAVWYERARPPVQVVALVAALAALAVAGRVAFAPVPNVVPTTDIALIAGYSLGGAPGFAVGALSGLASNFWLGQGPWTPWQMAGWGIAGALGALLAVVTRGRVGRLGLAACCGLAGLAFGALLDLSLMVTYGGEQSLDRFLALSARGIPFNLAHAGGNFALALAAGPAMVRMLTRYRKRFEFAWLPGDPRPQAAGEAGGARRPTRPVVGAACVLAALVVLAGGAGGPQDASGARSSGPGAAVKWLRGAQNADGGFGFARGEASSPAMTGWAVLGLEAAGVNPLDLRRSGATPVAYLGSTISRIRTTGDIERTILVLAGAGLDPRSFRGRDLVSRLLARRGADGSWGGQVNPTAFGILALEAAGRVAGNRRSAAWLRNVANPDGGWGFAPGAASDPDSTGAVLQALAVAGGGRAAIRAGAAYLRGAQRGGGGFALSGSLVNAQSTAWAVQGAIAARVSPRSLRRGGRSPLDYLAAVQAADGHYRYSRASDQTPVWVTGQALLGVRGLAFPLERVPRRSRPARASAEDGGGGPPAAPAAAGGGGDGVPERPAGGAEEGVTGASKSGLGEKPGSKAGDGGATGPGLPRVQVAPAASTDPSDEGGSSAATLAAAGLAALAALGAVLMLRRQGRS